MPLSLPPSASNPALPGLHRATCKSAAIAANQRRGREERGGVERSSRFGAIPGRAPVPADPFPVARWEARSGTSRGTRQIHRSPAPGALSVPAAQSVHVTGTGGGVLPPAGGAAAAGAAPLRACAQRGVAGRPSAAMEARAAGCGLLVSTVREGPGGRGAAVGRGRPVTGGFLNCGAERCWHGGAGRAAGAVRARPGAAGRPLRVSASVAGSSSPRSVPPRRGRGGTRRARARLGSSPSGHSRRDSRDPCVLPGGLPLPCRGDPRHRRCGGALPTPRCSSGNQSRCHPCVGPAPWQGEFNSSYFFPGVSASSAVSPSLPFSSSCPRSLTIKIKYCLCTHSSRLCAWLPGFYKPSFCLQGRYSLPGERKL